MNQQFGFYVGVDWAAEQHQACVMNAQGEVLEQRKVEHSGSGITGFMTWMEALVDGQVERIAVSIETPRGPLVEAFLEHRWAVFSINQKQLDRFRDRHTVAGAKDDSLDAYVLGDSLRTDQHCFRRVEADHAAVVRIRELSRTEDSVGTDLRRTANQLYQLLLRYYPQLLQLSATPDEPWLWANSVCGAAPSSAGNRWAPSSLPRCARAPLTWLALPAISRPVMWINCIR